MFYSVGTAMASSVIGCSCEGAMLQHYAWMEGWMDIKENKQTITPFKPTKHTHTHGDTPDVHY